MPFEVEHEHTLRQALEKPFNLFLGAGFSFQAKDATGKNLPIGNALRNELADHFAVPDLKELSLARLCRILESKHKESLRSFFVSRFTVKTYDPAYSVLRSLQLSAIFTTNIDNLIPEIFEPSNTKYLKHVVVSGPAFGERTAIDYVALHGSILYDKPFRFDPMDLSTAFANDRDLWHILTERIQRVPTIFCGYGLNDPGVLEALSPETIQGRRQEDKWILLRQPTDADKAFFRAMGFKIMIGETLDLLKWLERNSPAPAILPTPSKTNHPALRPYRIPNVSSLAVRPIADFYSGAAPRWTDIFSGRLYRLSHFDRIKNSILSKKDVAVIGTFASGKSTLLMQLAADIQFSGVKLVCLSLTLEAAQLITRVLDGSPAMVFLDDFASSARAFEYLRGRGNIQLIGFDRDFAFERVSHLIDRQGLKFEGCSDLSDEDLQSLLATVPLELKTRTLSKPVTEGGARPTMYETVVTNIIKPALKRRFASVLQDLEKNDRTLHDFLVMCCYVHSCKTPVSLDMAIAFLRGDVNATEVHEVTSRLDSLIVDFKDPILDQEDDYFVPRSTIISSAVLENVSQNSFKRVLKKFHDDVSVLRIVQFDVFRRHGFDEEFATKAFGHWEEGLAFYNSLLGRDSSFYLRQQAALYLMHKRQFQEAFKWIDTAINESRGRIPSIRNSHAVILFRANIDLVGNGDPVVEDTLRRSMTILIECYRVDKRGVYHALTFADQSIKYWKAFSDQNAWNYLKTAVSWLRKEQQNSSWHSRIPHLLREVETLVSRNRSESLR